MKCTVHMHDPCEGLVLECRLSLTGGRVPLCTKHVTAWDNRTTPFRWQTLEQLERWAREAAARAARKKVTA